MKPVDFYRLLAEKEAVTVTLSPGPFKISVGPQDAMAARLLLWLFEQMPDDATQGDLEAVLDAAKWWSVFWASALKANEDGEAKEIVEAVEEFLNNLTSDNDPNP